MQTYKATLTPRSAFGMPIKGDTLFGQLCWALRNRLAEARLTELLDGYTAGRPFAVVSDALPAGHLPRPALPGHVYRALAEGDRKAAKKRVWLPIEHATAPLADWLMHCRTASELPGGAPQSHPHPHNAIDRRTGTTGEGFAPYSQTRHWYGEGTKLDVWIVLDETRLDVAELEQALADIGELGFGRDAGIGLGRYQLESLAVETLPAQADANAWLTLAPCAPQGLGWDGARSFYTVFTRFGRHGDVGVQSGKPFKAPALLAQTGALLTPAEFHSQAFTGQGVGGDGSLSNAIPATVQQGYAPVIGVCLPRIEKDA